ncbi:MAG: contractile injection system protein, VgrG/Pvc8 family [Myxococcales bacterium]|nr:contractile injection system protein, VgrG/Pvc8 family [Myxococcales bacterium]
MECDHAYSIQLETPGQPYDIGGETDSLSVEEQAGRPSQLDVTVPDPERVMSHTIREGIPIQVALGSISDQRLVFRGLVTQVEGDFPEEGAPSLRITAHDQRVRMGLKERSRHLRNQKLEQLVQSVAEEYFLKSDVSVELDTDIDFGAQGVRQSRETDLRFLLRLAQQTECQVLLETDGASDKFRFVALSKLYRDKSRLALTYQRDGVEHLLLSFKPRVDVGEVRLSKHRAAVDPESGNETTAVQAMAVPPAEEDIWLDEGLGRWFGRFPQRTQQLSELQRASIARAENVDLGAVAIDEAPPFLTGPQRAILGKNVVARRLRGMRAEGRSVGLPGLRAGRMVNIQGVGRFSGDWYLTQVRHTVDGSGYHTEFECER